MSVFFFFSSRRRHTRFDCDWSSDVCSSDLYPSRTVLVAGGIGAFTPRKLPLKDADLWYGRGLYDRILDPAVFSGKRVLLVGGGDSAFDWAVNLQGVAQRVLMIHRRDGFRAHAATVKQVQELSAAAVDHRSEEHTSE